MDLFVLLPFCTKVSKPAVVISYLNEHWYQDFLRPCYLQTFGFTIQSLEVACSTDLARISKVIGVFPVDWYLLTMLPPGIDSSLANNFGRSLINMLSVTTTLITISVIGGVPFILAMICLGFVYYHCEILLSVSFFPSLRDATVAKNYGQTSRDMRRLGATASLGFTFHYFTYSRTTDSVTRSPLYSIYGETIAGVTILRAFGASSKFLRDMLRCVDTVRIAKSVTFPL